MEMEDFVQIHPRIDFVAETIAQILTQYPRAHRAFHSEFHEPQATATVEALRSLDAAHWRTVQHAMRRE